MFQQSKVLTTLFFGAVSGFGFYSVSYPVTQLSTFATHYFLPSSAKDGSTVHKMDRFAVADTFEGRWPRFAAVQSASAEYGQMQISASDCPLSLA
jgi:hypothetical protein